MSAKPAVTTEAFVNWAIAQLELDSRCEGGVYHVEVPDARRDKVDLPGNWAFTFDPLMADDSTPLVTAASPLVGQLAGALCADGQVAHARPRSGPVQVHEITERLFRAYTIEGGRVDLAGCNLEERPFLRLTIRVPGTDGSDSPALWHTLVDVEGNVVPEPLAVGLGLTELKPCGEVTPRLRAAAIDRLRQAARTEFARRRQQAFGDSAVESEEILATLVWCKYASGKLRFSIGEAVAELPFAGWARLLEPPPFRCPKTGAEGYAIGATDDMQITVATQIAVCEVSGRRALTSELVTCSATGQQVLQKFTTRCPVTDGVLLESELMVCPICYEPISPAARSGEGCLACDRPNSVSKSDPRLARLLGEYPRLDRWRQWQLSETRGAYVAVALGIFKRLLVVLDKESLEPHYVATSSRLNRRWRVLEGPLRDGLFR